MNQPAFLEEANPQHENNVQSESDKGDPFLTFDKQFTALASPDDRVQMAIAFMKEALTTGGAPYFRAFWEVRKLCIPLFKEKISSPLRTQLWGEYIELTREGRRLKDLLDEEAAFAVEQIEMAISSLEAAVVRFEGDDEAVLAKSGGAALPCDAHTLEARRPFYETGARRLHLLNAFAAQIHALRKELIGTQMRIRFKNKFFERLSAIGDKVFPKRKELIKEVSTAFLEDVNGFVQEYFSKETFCPERVRRQVFSFREEIKALQATAKALTLNTEAFAITREQLSSCWDMLKGMEKELKREFAQQKHKSTENSAVVQEKLEALKAGFTGGQIGVDETLRSLDEISRYMREIELTHSDVKELKEQMRQIRALPEEKKQQEEEARRRRDQEEEERKRSEIARFKERVEELRLALQTEGKDVVALEATFVTLREELAALNIPKREKQLFERPMKEVRDLVEERKEKALLNLSEDDKAALGHLKEVFDQRKQRRVEVKNRLEEYRRIMGGSTLNFEKAIEYGELVAQEKERLEKIEESIREVEEKIVELKKKA